MLIKFIELIMLLKHFVIFL